ncbi:MAG: hypothetical protein J6K89_05820, partial [Oscillospiraceae bacterium]|nr:hypothetical protein [Oscillospiraceae bacterium]
MAERHEYKNPEKDVFFPKIATFFTTANSWWLSDAQWRLLKKSDFQNRTPKKREILRYMVSKCSEYAEFCGKNFYK